MSTKALISFAGVRALQIFLLLLAQNSGTKHREGCGQITFEEIVGERGGLQIAGGRKCLLKVEFINQSALLFYHTWQSRCGIHIGRGADYQEQITVDDQVFYFLHTSDCFAKQNNIWLEWVAA